MLEVRLLGQFDVRLDGAPIELASRPAQSLLAYLLLNAATAHRREKLAGLLWPDTSEANARKNLRQALWQVRKALKGRDYLIADDLTVVFDTSLDYSLDASVLQRKITDGLSADDLLAIVSLYSGDLLPGFYDEWVILERERLQAVFENKMKLLLDRLGEAQRWENVLEWGERWIALGHTPEPAYRALMIAHAGMGDLSKMAATHQRCVEALKDELGVGPSEQTRLTFERLARGEQPPGLAAAPTTPPAFSSIDEPPAPGEPPFKGLQHFDEADADLFFGRERLIAKLASHLREHHFLAVVGASGSGKSSIVRAGLVPTLKRRSSASGDGEPRADDLHLPEGSADWLYYIITPTAHPLEALAASLTRDSESVTAIATLMDDLARDPRSLHLFIKRAAHLRSAPHVLLIVDQFEELFTLCRDEPERRVFIDNLMTAVAPETAGPTTVILTLRADFYAHCAQYANLREAVARHQEYIGPMSAGELRRAIEEPAKRGGWAFEPGLVDLLLREVGEEPGGLPLLSHALLETWRRRRGRTLTLKGYAESGGVRGAIARTAESVYQRLAPDQQAIARNIFIRLTELGEGTQDTRRRAALSELLPHREDAPVVTAVLKTLADSRLITTAEESAEVAHEALIREWPTLRQWLAEDREGLRLHRHLTEAAQAWDGLERDPGELYRGARLAQAVDWAEAHVRELNALERAFLDESRAWAEREEAEREAQQRRELEAARKLAESERQRAEAQTHSANRLRTRNRIITAVGAVALVLAVVAVVFGAQSNENATRAQTNLAAAQVAEAQAVSARATAEAEQQRAESETKLATSRELAIAAVNNVDVDPERSILLALHALSQTYTKEAEEALHQSVQALRMKLKLVGHTYFVHGVAFSPDGKSLATASEDGSVKVWDTATGQQLLILKTAPDGWALDVAFSPDGARLAAAVENTLARVWDAKTGQELLVLSGHTDKIDKIVFSPDGTRLATGSDDGTAKVWDAVTGEELLTLSGHTSWIGGIAFSPDGTRLATASDDATTRIWDATTGQELLKIVDNESTLDVAFSPDGTRLVTGHRAGAVKIRDAASGSLQLTLSGHTITIFNVAFSSDGTRVASTSIDRTARLWDAATGQELLILAGHSDALFGVAFNPDGTLLATGSVDKTARIWDISPAGSRELLTIAGGRFRSVAYSPDEKRLVTGSFEGVAQVWDAESGEELLTLAGHTGAVYDAVYSPDGTRIATASGDKTAKVWDAATGQALLTLSGHGEGLYGNFFPGVLSVAFSPDGKRIATAGADHLAKVWDATTGEELLTLTGHTAALGRIRFSLDGRLLATTSDETDATARIWDAASGRQLHILTGHPVRTWGVAFSPDGRRLVTAGWAGVVKMWDVATGQELMNLVGHISTALDATYSADGARVATSSGDGQVKIWDAATGSELLNLSGHTGTIWSITFNHDRSRLVSSSLDGTVRVYTLKLEDLIELARSRVTRSLTVEECQRFLHLEQCPEEP